jgi:hypothetical protein
VGNLRAVAVVIPEASPGSSQIVQAEAVLAVLRRSSALQKKNSFLSAVFDFVTSGTFLAEFEV